MKTALFAAILLASCTVTETPWPNISSTGALVTYNGRWGETMAGTMPPPDHTWTLVIEPVRTPPLACSVHPQSNGDVELAPC